MGSDVWALLHFAAIFESNTTMLGRHMEGRSLTSALPDIDKSNSTMNIFLKAFVVMVVTLEKIRFHFDGALSKEHHLNFYEAARFQYAAARLTTKLIQFQHHGRFTRRITDKTNTNALLATHRDGSFDISILVPFAMVAAETFVTVPISTLMSYVFERILGKTDNKNVVDALNAQSAIAEQFGKISDNDSAAVQRALEIIERQQDNLRDVNDQNTKFLERRIAELERERSLGSQEDQIKRIDGARQEKLLAMAAPLVAEMATALRRSADTLEIYDETSDETSRRFLYLDQEMAEEVIVSKVDDEMTSIRVDIVQYNKETGYGKLRLTTSHDLITFNVPTDVKERLRGKIMQEMNKTQTFVQVYFVRDRTREPKRMILVGIIDE